MLGQGWTPHGKTQRETSLPRQQPAAVRHRGRNDHAIHCSLAMPLNARRTGACVLRNECSALGAGIPPAPTPEHEAGLRTWYRE